MRGLLLDRAGRPEGRSTIDEVRRRAAAARGPERHGLEAILADLEASRDHQGPFVPRGSLQSWRETLYSTVADGAAVTTAAEAILVPDYTLPAGYMNQGRTLKYTLHGRISSAITTPGTFTWKLRWGGVGGTQLVTTGALAPDSTAAATNVAWVCEFYMVCRSIGSSGTALSWGRMYFNDASATSTWLNNQMLAFPDANAAVTIDTTTAKALSPTITPSLATGSVTCHHALLETLN